MTCDNDYDSLPMGVKAVIVTCHIKRQLMIEHHPLKPFLPSNGKVLFLGSFPPPKKRWCMDFFYPNFINDHWRIEGQIWFGDKNHFVDTERKCFKMNEIMAFLSEKGIALFDTAMAVSKSAMPFSFRNVMISFILKHLRSMSTKWFLSPNQICPSMRQWSLMKLG